MNDRDTILSMLEHFIKQRPGMDPRNYGSWADYRAEGRKIARQRRDALTLLRAVRWRESISADDLLAASRSAFSGRLEIKKRDDGKYALSYCTGQYFPTEFRAAACAVLSSALWVWTREHAMPAPSRAAEGTPEWSDGPLYHGLNAGTWLRTHFKKEFGRHLAARWFD